MSVETIKAIKKANQFMHIIEQVTAHYNNELHLAVSDNPEENPFYHLSRLTSEKYGPGHYLSLLLIQQGMNSMLYFQGKLDEESYQECKEYITNILEEIDNLSQSSINTYLH